MKGSDLISKIERKKSEAQVALSNVHKKIRGLEKSISGHLESQKDLLEKIAVIRAQSTDETDLMSKISSQKSIEQKEKLDAEEGKKKAEAFLVATQNDLSISEEQYKIAEKKWNEHQKKITKSFHQKEHGRLLFAKMHDTLNELNSLEEDLARWEKISHGHHEKIKTFFWFKMLKDKPKKGFWGWARQLAHQDHNEQMIEKIDRHFSSLKVKKETAIGVHEKCHEEHQNELARACLDGVGQTLHDHWQKQLETLSVAKQHHQSALDRVRHASNHLHEVMNRLSAYGEVSSGVVDLIVEKLSSPETLANEVRRTKNTQDDALLSKWEALSLAIEQDQKNLSNLIAQSKEQQDYLNHIDHTIRNCRSKGWGGSYEIAIAIPDVIPPDFFDTLSRHMRYVPPPRPRPSPSGSPSWGGSGGSFGGGAFKTGGSLGGGGFKTGGRF